MCAFYGGYLEGNSRGIKAEQKICEASKKPTMTKEEKDAQDQEIRDYLFKFFAGGCYAATEDIGTKLGIKGDPKPYCENLAAEAEKVYTEQQKQREADAI